jgi:hypothetical protein
VQHFIKQSNQRKWRLKKDERAIQNLCDYEQALAKFNAADLFRVEDGNLN